jgi:transposase
VRNKRVWERACGLTRTVVEGVDFDDDAQAIVVSVRPVAKARSRCGLCGRRSPVTTSATGVGGGGRWIWGLRKCFSRRLRRGFGVGRMG